MRLLCSGSPRCRDSLDCRRVSPRCRALRAVESPHAANLSRAAKTPSAVEPLRGKSARPLEPLNVVNTPSAVEPARSASARGKKRKENSCLKATGSPSGIYTAQHEVPQSKITPPLHTTHHAAECRKQQHNIATSPHAREAYRLAELKIQGTCYCKISW